MALTQAEKDEIQRMLDGLPCNEHGRLSEEMRSELIGYRETMQTLAKAMERLSLVVVGDDELKIVGLGQRVQQVEGAQNKLREDVERRWQRDDIQRTKIVFFVIGAAAVMNAAFRLVAWVAGLLGLGGIPGLH
jgi:hypothetical protein